MTIPLQDSPSLILVKVPKDAYDIFIGYFSNGLCYRGGDNKPEQNIVLLPKGAKLIGKLSDILKDEELCKELRLSRAPSDTDADDFLIVKIL